MKHMSAAAGSVAQNGQPAWSIRTAAVYAPTAKKAPCPSEICPLKPVSRMRPSTAIE